MLSPRRRFPLHEGGVLNSFRWFQIRVCTGVLGSASATGGCGVGAGLAATAGFGAGVAGACAGAGLAAGAGAGFGAGAGLVATSGLGVAGACGAGKSLVEAMKLRGSFKSPRILDRRCRVCASEPGSTSPSRRSPLLSSTSLVAAARLSGSNTISVKYLILCCFIFLNIPILCVIFKNLASNCLAYTAVSVNLCSRITVISILPG